MSCVIVVLINRHSENMHKTIFIIVIHLNSGTFVRKRTVNYSYCDLSAEIIALIIDIVIL